jgi:quercetin dioxygenase-like cupin family protein
MTEPADELRLRVTDVVPEGLPHFREFLYDEIETRLPRDPQARVNVNLSGLGPGQAASWHIHNGLVFFLIVQGIVTLQYEDTEETYRAGDVYTEPVGVVHRAINPHEDLSASLVGFWVTAADRPHFTNVPPPAYAG